MPWFALAARTPGAKSSDACRSGGSGPRPRWRTYARRGPGRPAPPRSEVARGQRLEMPPKIRTSTRREASASSDCTCRRASSFALRRDEITQAQASASPESPRLWAFGLQESSRTVAHKEERLADGRNRGDPGDTTAQQQGQVGKVFGIVWEYVDRACHACLLGKKTRPRRKR
jgi:hypothetical protein